MNEALSFEDFVGARADALMRYAYVLTGDPHDAADLLQGTLVRVRAAWHGVHNKREPEGYVRTTMARLHISVWRGRRRERPTNWSRRCGGPSPRPPNAPRRPRRASAWTRAPCAGPGRIHGSRWPPRPWSWPWGAPRSPAVRC
ncbi:sigma factor [Actinoallomurus iriomotensis]|uniref:RNA polymerase sigma-70 region 2 domain-containing protein n=1 Tax=Actinoallomurus iriomotensis TaxID=478107 RepID=A0A9W6VM88_9ACTN|nr:sigma factor [Actinoallomurus iriomotensis]GLY73460.1 hypothetical protein Airi01_017270 [Actinoallomurus iriomotensis]